MSSGREVEAALYAERDAIVAAISRFVRPEYVCERCGHRIYQKRLDYWLHWDEDEAWDGCPCVDEDDECVAIEREERAYRLMY